MALHKQVHEQNSRQGMPNKSHTGGRRDLQDQQSKRCLAVLWWFEEFQSRFFYAVQTVPKYYFYSSWSGRSEEEGKQQHQHQCLQIKSIRHFNRGEPKTASPRRSCCSESLSEWFGYSVFTKLNVLTKMSAQASFASNCPKRALEKGMWHWGTYLVGMVMVGPGNLGGIFQP